MNTNTSRVTLIGAGLLIAVGLLLGLILSISVQGIDTAPAWRGYSAAASAEAVRQHLDLSTWNAEVADAKSSRSTLAIILVVVGAGLGLTALVVRPEAKR